MRRTLRLLLSAVFVFALVPGCRNDKPAPEKRDLARLQTQDSDHSKKVILLSVDSLLSNDIDEGIKQHRLPTFQYLIKHGQYYRDLVTSFPTMSVTIDSSLLTGTYPDDHRVPGLLWYSAKDRRVVSYSNGPMEMVRKGINSMLTDALIDLNGSHLNPKTPTLFEDLAKKGRTSGSVNGLVYRGSTEHVLSIPPWVHAPTALPKEIKVKGPDFLAFGALSDPLQGHAKLPKGITDKMGFTNEYSVQAVQSLIKDNHLPDFLYVYFPDMDKKVHNNGPSVLDEVVQVDKQIHSLLQTFGSSEKALEKAVFIIIGDSGASQIRPASEQPVIDLPRLLNRFDVLRPGQPVTEKTEIILAANETMAYVYKLKQDHSVRNITDALKNERRIDFMAWKEDGWIHVLQAGTSQQFRYRVKGDVVDPYNQSWTLDNNPKVLDITVDRQNHTLKYGRYPDALRRLSGALNSHKGEYIVVTAKPGYELVDRGSPTHKGGGAHGSLHKKESLIPLLICGTDQKPDYLRIVDVKPFIQKLLSNR